MSKKELRARSSQGSMWVIASGLFEATDSLAKTFQAVAAKRVLDVASVRKDPFDPDAVDDQGFLRDNHWFRPEWLGAEYEVFSRQTTQALWNAVERTVQVARWIQSAETPPFPLAGRPAMWSFDGRHWSQLPQRVHAEAWSSAILNPTVDLKTVKRMVASGVAEPLAHQLWLEARSLQSSNRRSALVIGVAALEVGVKQYIASRVPEAEWLVFNLQSPPVVAVLKVYIPNLPAVHTIEGHVLPPSKRLMKILDDGVSLRNRVVHRGELEWKPGQLVDLLEGIRDVLYLLDYYGGQEWAKDRLSYDLQQELKFMRPANRTPTKAPS